MTITLGWESQLQGYFCTVERNDAEGNEAFVYSNLEDEALAKTKGLAESVDYFDALLMALGLIVPRAMLDEVERDGALDVGNRHVWYAATEIVARSAL